MNTLGNLLFSIILTFAGFSSFIINDNWPEINLEKQITLIPFDIQLEAKTPSYADRFHAFKDTLINSYGLNETRAGNFADWILIGTHNTSITPHTVAALIMTESSFRYNISSHAGAVGPAQVIPFFWRELCHGDLENDPQMNIKCGVSVLERYKKRCDDNLKCALEMYNVGPTNFHKEKYAGAKKRYVDKITRHKNKILAFIN